MEVVYGGVGVGVVVGSGKEVARVGMAHGGGRGGSDGGGVRWVLVLVAAAVVVEWFMRL